MRFIYLAVLTILQLTVVTAQNNYVGIGTNNPAEKLDVAGDIRVNTAYIKGDFSTLFGSKFISTNTSTNTIQFANGGLAITSSQKVGMGTTNPLQELHVVGDIKISNWANFNSLKGPLKNSGDRTSFYSYNMIDDISYLADESIAIDGNRNTTIKNNLTSAQVLEIQEGIKVGSENGSITSMVKTSVSLYVGNLEESSGCVKQLSVPGVTPQMAVCVSPSGQDFPGGVGVGYAFVLENDIVRFYIFNLGSNDKNLGTVNFNVFAIK